MSPTLRTDPVIQVIDYFSDAPLSVAMHTLVIVRELLRRRQATEAAHTEAQVDRYMAASTPPSTVRTGTAASSGKKRRKSVAVSAAPTPPPVPAEVGD